MPTSAPGSRQPAARAPVARRGRGAAGFTLIELLLVITLIALASGLASLALRDPSETRLDQDAVRLIALLESARAEARAAGLPARWEPVAADPAKSEGAGFRFFDLPELEQRPTRWLHEGVSAQVVGARAVQLGPEPVIAAQRIVIALDDRMIVLATDGLAPFAVAPGEVAPAR